MYDPTISYPTQDDFIDLLTDSAPVSALLDDDSSILCVHLLWPRRFS
jgi:hypothetical protein